MEKNTKPTTFNKVFNNIKSNITPNKEESVITNKIEPETIKEATVSEEIVSIEPIIKKKELGYSTLKQLRRTGGL